MDQHFTSQTVSTDSRPAPISAGYASGVREECGIFGIYDTAGGGVSREIYRACAPCSTGARSPAASPSLPPTVRLKTFGFTRDWGW